MENPSGPPRSSSITLSLSLFRSLYFVLSLCWPSPFRSPSDLYYDGDGGGGAAGLPLKGAGGRKGLPGLLPQLQQPLVVRLADGAQPSGLLQQVVQHRAGILPERQGLASALAQCLAARWNLFHAILDIALRSFGPLKGPEAVCQTCPTETVQLRLNGGQCGIVGSSPSRPPAQFFFCPQAVWHSMEMVRGPASPVGVPGGPSAPCSARNARPAGSEPPEPVESGEWLSRRGGAGGVGAMGGSVRGASEALRAVQGRP